MTGFWITVLLPILAGCVFIALFNLVCRYAGNNARLATSWFLTCGFAYATALFAVIYLLFWGVSYPPVTNGFWKAVIGTSLASLVIEYLGVKALSIDAGEVSLSAPLQAMTPGLITLLALILGEFPGKLGISGVVLMSIGSYILLYEGEPKRWTDYFSPLKRLRSLLNLRQLTASERAKTLVVTMSLGAAAMGTVGLLFGGLYVRRSNGLQGIILGAIVLTVLSFLTYLVLYRLDGMRRTINGSETSRVAEKPSVKNWPLFVVFAVVWVGHVFCINPTFNHTFVAYVGTLKRLSILLSVVLGFLLFKEQMFKRRLVVAVIIIVGATLISLDGAPQRLTARMEGLGL